MGKVRKTESVTIRLTPEEKWLLEEVFRTTGKPVSEIVRRILDDKFDYRSGNVELEASGKGK